MSQARSWAWRAIALPAVILLGTANMGCPGAKGSGTGATNAGGGGSGGATGGSTAGSGGATAGSGGATCVAETEICDGKDNDCNGMVDDVPGVAMCQCNDGATQGCYTGPDGTSGKGACKDGQQTCVNGAWGECAGQVVPKAEECNTVDDDCNDAVDDMGQAMCGVGACAAVVDKCVNGQAQQCIPGAPTVEVCDGIDNNCNQLTDETDPMLDANCNSGQQGVCAAGKQKCIMGALTCMPNIMASAEQCDGKDNDCNGAVDDNIPGTGSACSTGALGVCSAGTLSCQDAGGGQFTIDCFQNIAASPETCDGLDNDCDGSVDQGDPGGGGACDTGLLGECQAGTLHCQGGMIQCVQNKMPSAEVCDAKDNNCDGQSDEGNPGGGQACGCAGSGVTSCQNGVVSCNGGPISYFFDDFKDNTKGWTLDTEWQIGPAVAGPAGNCADPGVDASPTADNGIAGVVIGGCSTSSVSKTVHGYYYLTSPPMDTSAAPSVYLNFRRWLHSDYTPYMNNTIEVFNGATWTIIWQSGATGIHDTSWQTINHNITAYKAANMQVRFGFNIGSTGVFNEGSWSVDDVTVASAVCP